MLAWVQLTAGVSSPTDSPLVRATLWGFKRELAKPVMKKSPFTAQKMEAIPQDAKKT